MILPRYILERVYLPNATPGSLYNALGAPGNYSRGLDPIAKTLELPWRNNAISPDPFIASCVPEGIYLVVLQPASTSRNYPYYRFVHVPGRHWHPDTRMSSVLIHRGNYATDLLGCIIPGSRHRDINLDSIPDIEESSKKLAWMIVNLENAFELEIRKKFTDTIK